MSHTITHLFSVPTIKAEPIHDSKPSTINDDDDDDDQDDDIAYVGYSLGMVSAPLNTLNKQNSNKGIYKKSYFQKNNTLYILFKC